MSAPTRTSRFGGVYPVAWRRLRDVAANESKPNAKAAFLHVPTSKILWLVKLPNGITGATIHVGRWVESERDAAGAALAFPSEDDRVVVSGLSGENTETIAQDSWGDDLALWIDGIGGAGTAVVLYKLIEG